MMEYILINYEDKCKIALNADCEVIDIECSLPIVGEGNNRIVYDLGDKVLKVAKSSMGSFNNRNEYNLCKYLENKSKKLKIKAGTPYYTNTVFLFFYCRWIFQPAGDMSVPLFFSIFSIKMPYPLVGSPIITCVTEPISFPFWITGLPLIP